MQEEIVSKEIELGPNFKNPRPIYFRFSADLVLGIGLLSGAAWGICYSILSAITHSWDDKGTPIVLHGDKGAIISFTAKEGSEVHMTVIPVQGGK